MEHRAACFCLVLLQPSARTGLALEQGLYASSNNVRECRCHQLLCFTMFNATLTLDACRRCTHDVYTDGRLMHVV